MCTSYHNSPYTVIITKYIWHEQDEFEDTKGVIRICNSKKDRQHNVQKKRKRQKDKQQSTKHIHKTKDRVTRTPLKPGG